MKCLRIEEIQSHCILERMQRPVQPIVEHADSTASALITKRFDRRFDDVFGGAARPRRARTRNIFSSSLDTRIFKSHSP